MLLHVLWNVFINAWKKISHNEEIEMFRRALGVDLPGVMQIIQSIVAEMKYTPHPQWDEKYPTAKDFEQDIKREELYVLMEGKVIKGFVCLNQIEADAYQTLRWSSSESCLVIHRLGVHPDYRNQGVATELLEAVEKIALQRQIKYLKTDTYSVNYKMQAIFTKCNYHKVGELYFEAKPEVFYAYEKQL